MEDSLHPSMAGGEGSARCQSPLSEFAVEYEGCVRAIRAVALVRQQPGRAEPRKCDYFFTGALASAVPAGFMAAAGLGDQNAGSPAISCGEA